MAGADIAIDVIAAQMATQNMVNGSDPAQQIVNGINQWGQTPLICQFGKLN